MHVPRAIVLLGTLAFLLVGCDKDGGEAGKASGETKAEKPAAPAGPTALTDEKLAKLATLQLPGFKSGMAPKPMMGQITLYFTGKDKNAQGVAARIMLQMGRCVGSACRAMDKATWVKEKDRTYERMMMPKVHVDNDKKEWTIDEARVAGKKLITVRTFSYVESVDDKGGTSRASMNGLSLNYNNGKNHVRIGISGMGSFAKSEQEARASFPPAEMMKVGTKIFEAVLGHLEG